MAFVIPNAQYTGSGQKFTNLNQAEPDSLDFEILGSNGRSGVVSGLEVTTDGSNLLCSSGTVVINGVPYNLSSSVIGIGSATSAGTSRFDLVIARLSGSTVTVQVLNGTEDDTNVEFPLSYNVTNTTPTSANVNLATDVVLAAVFRDSSTTISNVHIADRRMLVVSSIVHQGTGDPSPTFGGTGTLYYKNTVGNDTSSSGIYIKNASGTWVNVAQDFGPQIPVGSVIPWMGAGAVPAGWLECNGSSFSSTTYPDLYAVLGSTTLPNLVEKHLRGGTSVNVGTSVSGTTDSVSLLIANVPQHAHTISHTHTMDHRHTGNHDHGSQYSGYESASHTHGPGTLTTDTEAAHTHSPSNTSPYVSYALRSSIAAVTDGAHYYAGYSADGDGIIDGLPSGTTFGMAITYSGAHGSAGSHAHSVDSGATASSNSTLHRHVVDIDATTGVYTGNSILTTGTAARSSTDDTNTTNTGNAGANPVTSFSVKPPALYTRWIIRATGLVATDIASSYAEALEETVTVELIGSGSLSTGTGVAYYRMPWAATLTGVKANRNGTNTNGSVTIDINEDGTSVLSTLLTIDISEASSLNAATPVVIGDSSIASDALLTFDIDAADTSDEGPLTVTLYFNRVA